MITIEFIDGTKQKFEHSDGLMDSDVDKNSSEEGFAFINKVNSDDDIEETYAQVNLSQIRIIHYD